METISKEMTDLDFNVGDQIYGKTNSNVGGFNFLNIPVSPDMNTFFEKYNKPFLDRAIDRNDDIIIVTPINDIINDLQKGKMSQGMYPLEIKYLVQKNYRPINITDSDWQILVKLLHK